MFTYEVVITELIAGDYTKIQSLKTACKLIQMEFSEGTNYWQTSYRPQSPVKLVR